MNRKMQVALIVIGLLTFGALMGVRQDLPALWMRIGAATAAVAVFGVAVSVGSGLARERRAAEAPQADVDWRNRLALIGLGIVFGALLGAGLELPGLWMHAGTAAITIGLYSMLLYAASRPPRELRRND